MSGEWGESESFEYSLKEGKVGCALRDSQLGNGGYSFSDTANFTTVGRSDKNAKRSGKMRCSLSSSSSFFFTLCLSPSLACTVALYEMYDKDADKIANGGRQHAKKFHDGAWKNSRFLQTALKVSASRVRVPTLNPGALLNS